MVPPDPALHVGRTGERLYRCLGSAKQFAEGGLALGGWWIRCRLAARSLERQRDKGLRPRSKVPQESREIRQASLQTAQPDRDHVRPPQGLATRRNTIRPMPLDLPLRNSPRSNDPLLALNLIEML